MGEAIDAYHLVRVWNRALGERFPLRPELARQFLSLHVDPAASRVDEDGFVVVKRSGDQAWLAALAVDPARQRRGLGSALLSHAATALLEAGLTEATLGADHLHLLPGVPEPGAAPAFLARRGARLAEPVVDLHHRLSTWQPPDGLPATEPATSWEPVLQFLRRVFPDRWLWVAEELRRRGGRPDGYLLLRDGAGGTIGFAQLHDSARPEPLIGPSLYWSPAFGGVRTGGLGPIGLDAARRGEGLGLGLLLAGLARLREAGIDHTVIDWTSLVGFYAKAGFVPWRRYRPGRIDLRAAAAATRRRAT